jgi:hypothetical protein
MRFARRITNRGRGGEAMSEIDDLFRRVEAAKASLDEMDHGHARQAEDLNRRLDEAIARLDRQQVVVRDLEARNEILKGENRQLKSMLLALLAAVESRSTPRLQETLRDMDGRLGAMASPEPEPLFEPEPEPVLELADEPEPEPESEAEPDLPASIRRMLFADDDEQPRPSRAH